jgi:hypothetical protein
LLIVLILRCAHACCSKNVVAVFWLLLLRCYICLGEMSLANPVPICGFWPHITHVIVLTFKEIKHLSDYRTVGLSDCRIIGRTPISSMYTILYTHHHLYSYLIMQEQMMGKIMKQNKMILKVEKHINNHM